MNLFKLCATKEEYCLNLKIFLNKKEEIPVLWGNRTDLIQSVEDASRLYESVCFPVRRSIGIALSKEENTRPINKMLGAFAEQWLDLHMVTDRKFEPNDTAVFYGLYEDLCYDSLYEILAYLYERDIEYSFLIGRDIYSLSWICAKQFLQEMPADKNGIFTYKRWTKGASGLETIVEIYDSETYGDLNIKDIILNHEWSSILFHGHGKVDHINLGEYTLCGNNECIATQKGEFAPGCGHDNQSCFKDEEMLIHVNRIRACSIIMNSCNNGAFKDLACYGAKYNLLLNAIDSTAKYVTSSFAVQNSDLLEIRNYADCLGGQNPSDTFHESLKDIQQYPCFFEIGLHNKKMRNNNIIRPEQLDFFLNATDIAEKYISNGLLPKEHPILKRLEGFNKSATLFLRRDNQRNKGNDIKEWISKIESIDYSIAKTIQKNPNDAIMNFESYFISRSKIRKEIKTGSCSCGEKAIEYTLQGLITSMFNLEINFCYKCGDKLVRMEGSPEICVMAPSIVKKGIGINCHCIISSVDNGDITVGWFVPNYIEKYLEEDSRLYKFRGTRGATFDLDFEIKLSTDIPLQEYYFVVYAVQNFKISRCSQYFTII